MFFKKAAVIIRSTASATVHGVQRLFRKVAPILFILILPLLLIVALVGLVGSSLKRLQERPEVIRRSELLQKLLEEGVITSVNTWPYHPHGESASIMITWEVEGRNKGERFVYSPEAEDYDEVRIGQIPSDVFHALNPYYALRIIEHAARTMRGTQHQMVSVKMPIVVLKKGVMQRMFMIMRTNHAVSNVA